MRGSSCTPVKKTCRTTSPGVKWTATSTTSTTQPIGPWSRKEASLANKLIRDLKALLLKTSMRSYSLSSASTTTWSLISIREVVFYSAWVEVSLRKSWKKKKLKSTNSSFWHKNSKIHLILSKYKPKLKISPLVMKKQWKKKKMAR